MGTINPGDSVNITFEVQVPEDVPEEGGCFTVYDDPNGRGVICVRHGEVQQIRYSFTAIPSTGSDVFPGEIITYTVEIENTGLEDIDSLNILAPSISSQTTCQDDCSGFSLSGPLEPQGIISFSYSVKISDTATGQVVQNPLTINFGDDSVETESIIHNITAVPPPTGDFIHDISLTRHFVLNSKDGNKRSDNGDKSEVEHKFTFTGTNQSYVIPEMNGNRNYYYTYCRRADNPYTRSYDATWNSYAYAYNSDNRSSTFGTFESIRSDDMDFQIVTDLPDNRPDIIEYDSSNNHRDSILFPMTGSVLNVFMKNGGTRQKPQVGSTFVRAIKDGRADQSGAIGEINTENQAKTPYSQGFVYEDRWQYVVTSSYLRRCIRCGRRSCSRWYESVYTYNWRLVSSQQVEMKADDKDYISAYTSTAWLQTHGGHLLSNTIVRNPSENDANTVELSDASVDSTPKDYSPPGYYSSDFLVIKPSGGNTAFTSRLPSGGTIISSDKLAFLDSPIPGQEGTIQLSRGHSYDRSVNPREFRDDLINRQIYGKVVPLSQSSLNGSFIFEADSIYHHQGDLTIDGSPFIIDGGRARLYVEGSVTIKGNIAYSKTTDTELGNIPSLRLHATGNIMIDPSVTDIELMMLTEKEFHSGTGTTQLRILGDVIAHDAYWERKPLDDYEDDEEVNRPSERIWEDYRKYLITPPGDKILPDFEQAWREVNISSGKAIDWSRYTEE